MPFHPSAVGSQTKAFSWTYDWKTLAAYALGIGAKRDELDYLYEGTKDGIRSYPTIAVVPAFPAVVDLIAATGGQMATVVHGAQKVLIHRPLPPQGTVSTTGTLVGLFNLKKLVSAIIDTSSTLNGEPLFETRWTILFREQPDFESGRAPEDQGAVNVPKDRPADFSHREASSPEQALLYRISGDTNPLHADPAFAAKVGFAEGPILHGLATYGFAARALIKHAAGGDASKLKSFSAQFRKPVWPGDVLVTQGWNMGQGKWAISTAVEGKPDNVLTGAWAELT